MYVLKPYLFWLLATLSVALQFVVQMSSGLFIYGIASDFHAPAAEVGWMVASYYPIYVVMQIPSGLCVDHFGARRVLSLGCLVAGLGLTVFAHSHVIALAAFGRMMAGFGFSCCFVSLIYLMTHWFDGQQFSKLLGWSEAIGMFVVFGLQRWMTDAMVGTSWRPMIQMQADCALILACLIACFVQNLPHHHCMPKLQKSGLVFKQCFRQVHAIMRCPMAWRLSCAAGFIFTIVSVFASLWSPIIVEQKTHTPFHEAAKTSEILWLGVVLGVLAFGRLAKYRPQSIWTVLSGCLIGLILGFAAVLTSTTMTLWQVEILWFLLGLLSASYLLVFVLAQNLAPKNMRATFFGFLNTFVMMIPPCVQPCIGMWVDAQVHQRLHGIVPNPKHYVVSDFDGCLWAMIVMLGLSGILLLQFRRLKCKSPSDVGSVVVVTETN